MACDYGQHSAIYIESRCTIYGDRCTWRLQQTL